MADRLSGKEAACLCGVLVPSRVFLIDYNKYVGWVFFIQRFIMWASWDPLALELALMVLQINLTLTWTVHQSLSPSSQCAGGTHSSSIRLLHHPFILTTLMRHSLQVLVLWQSGTTRYVYLCRRRARVRHPWPAVWYYQKTAHRLQHWHLSSIDIL